MIKLKKYIKLLVLPLVLIQGVAFAGLEASLISIKTKLIGVILPLVSVIGLVVATFSFITGNPNAKQHIIYALIGSAIGFGAQNIVDFIGLAVY